jgi:hypothetical protein
VLIIKNMANCNIICYFGKKKLVFLKIWCLFKPVYANNSAFCLLIVDFRA